MAYLRSLREDDAGQLFLIGALALALIFVGLTVLLNTAIYTENLASRGSNVGGSNELMIQQDVSDFMETNMEYVNTNNTAYPAWSDKRDSFRSMSANWADISTLGYAQQGHLTRVTLDSGEPTPGYRLGQEDITRDFTNNAGATDWLVSGDNTKVRDFDMVVERDQLASTGSGDTFAVHLLTGGGFKLTGNSTYEIRISQSGSNAVVEVFTSGTSVGSCSAPENSTGYVHIELAEGRVGGEDCEILDSTFQSAGVSGSGYPLYYENADQIEGTWQVYTQTSPYFGVPPAFQLPGAYTSGPSAGSPFAYRAIYSTDVIIKVASDGGTFERTIQVTPGEHQ